MVKNSDIALAGAFVIGSLVAGKVFELQLKATKRGLVVGFDA